MITKKPWNCTATELAEKAIVERMKWLRREPSLFQKQRVWAAVDLWVYMRNHNL